MYIEKLINQAGYDILTIPTQEMWDTLRTGRLRSMRVRCAAPQSLVATDDETAGVKAGLVALHRATQTHYVEARMGMIRVDADINRGRGLRWFNWFRREREAGHGEISKVYADIIPEGETQSEPINLLAGQIGSRQRLEPPEDDPKASYQMREAFLSRVLREHRAELEKRYRQ
jgi:hypothetical protein